LVSPAESPASGENLLANLLLFARALRSAGLPVTLHQTLTLARALEWVNLGDRQQVFHAARSFLVHRAEDLALFGLLFDRFWRKPGEAPPQPRKAPRAPRHKEKERPFDVVTYMAYKARQGDREIEVADRSQTYSSLEILQRKDFSQMTPEELAAVERFIQEMRWGISRRPSRRRVSGGRGDQLDLGRVLREAARLDGVPRRLFHRRRKIKERPVVLLADVSGSMEKYSRLVLQLFYSVTHGLQEVECFVFGTRLTRLTPQLKLRNIDRALDEAAREVTDWAGGTRIGSCLGEFNRRWSRRVLRRGAVTVVVSDGWELGDAALLGREMAWLQRRCHRLVWLNPHLGRAGFEPRVEGMAAALPFVDDFLPVHNLQSLEALARALASLSERRSGARGIEASIGRGLLW
jgi:uncharacterized protein with von Willebrand factor type A (vWA) domain